MADFKTNVPFTIANILSSLSNTPDVKIKNPLDQTNFVNAIEFLPDPAFQLKGVLQISINDSVIFPASPVGFFRRFSSYSIPIGSRKLDRQGDIQIFAWNGLGDGSPISASGTVLISDKDADLSKASVPSTTPLMSDSVVLFPQTVRPVGVYTQQFDALGYKNFLFLISANPYVPPIESVIINQSGGSIANLAVDANLATFDRIGDPSPVFPAGTQDNILKFDFGSIASRQVAVKFQQKHVNGQGNGQRTIISVSSDDITYTVIYDVTVTATNPPTQTFVDITRSIRYCKVEALNTANSAEGLDLYEVFDNLIFGGTGALSFEAFDPASQQWIEFISASDLGTITQGTAVSKQVGTTMSQTNLNKIIPSNYASVRAKLTVTVTNIITSVSMIRSIA